VVSYLILEKKKRRSPTLFYACKKFFSQVTIYYNDFGKLKNVKGTFTKLFIGMLNNQSKIESTVIDGVAYFRKFSIIIAAAQLLVNGI